MRTTKKEISLQDNSAFLARPFSWRAIFICNNSKQPGDNNGKCWRMLGDTCPRELKKERDDWN